jgi:hypothetical protein
MFIHIEFASGMTYVLIPLGPSSSAIHLEKPMIPYLLAQYTAKPEPGPKPQILEVFTNVEPEDMCGIEARVTKFQVRYVIVGGH